MNRDLLRSHQNRNCQMILPYRFAYSLVYMKATWIWVLFQNHPIVSLYFFQWLSIWWLEDGALRDEKLNSKPGLIVDLLHGCQVIFAFLTPEQTRLNEPEHRVFSQDSSNFNSHPFTMNVLYFWSFISEYLLPSMITTELSSISDKCILVRSCSKK